MASSVETTVATTVNVSAEITSTVILVGFGILLLAIIIALYLANRDPDNSWHWLHLIQDNTGKSSLSKFLQFLGGITGTFVIIFQVAKNSLSVEMFSVYLFALGVSEAFSKFVSAKYGIKLPDNTPTTDNNSTDNTTK